MISQVQSELYVIEDVSIDARTCIHPNFQLLINGRQMFTSARERKLERGVQRVLGLISHI
jgi:hypothetical protein